MSLWKCTGWPFGDLNRKWQLWHQLAKKLQIHSSDHYKAWQVYGPSHGNYLIRFWRSSVGNFYFGKFSLKKWICFSRSNTILVISQEWLVRLMCNEKGVHRLDTGYNTSPWPLTSLMTLTLDISRSNFEIALSQDCWSDWCEKGNEVS